MIKQRIGAIVLSLSALGVAGMVAHEGMRRVAYVDPVGVVTVCAGHTGTAQLGQVKTPAECEALLKEDVKESEQAIRRLVRVPLTQDQFDALVSFTFNVGSGNLAKSTLLKKVNASDCWGAGAEFMRWVNGGGRELPGLVKRRANERQQWEKGCHRGIIKTRFFQYAQEEYLPLRAQARRPEPLSLTLLAQPLKPTAI
jgi:lysozyme